MICLPHMMVALDEAVTLPKYAGLHKLLLLSGAYIRGTWDACAGV
jgi:hypothetical protein